MPADGGCAARDHGEQQEGEEYGVEGGEDTGGGEQAEECCGQGGERVDHQVGIFGGPVGGLAVVAPCRVVVGGERDAGGGVQVAQFGDRVHAWADARGDGQGGGGDQGAADGGAGDQGE